MEPHQLLNLVQMIGFTLGRIDTLQKGYAPGSRGDRILDELSDQLIDISNYVKHCVSCICDPDEEEDEMEEIDDGL